MVDPALKKQILKDLDQLTPDLQRRAMEMVHNLVTLLPRGASVEDLLAVAGTLDAESARQMREAIEEDCEQVDADGW